MTTKIFHVAFALIVVALIWASFFTPTGNAEEIRIEQLNDTPTIWGR